jgi:hypothetical protein
MILPIAFAAGFAIGWWRAGKRGGTLADKLQYGAAHGIALLLIALFATIFADRMHWV